MKIVLLAGQDESVLRFRLQLLQALRDSGCDVLVLAPLENKHVPEVLAEVGVRFRHITLNRTGTNLFSDYRYQCEVHKILRAEAADVVLAYTIKPVVFGLLGAKKAGVRGIFALITGLGTAFHSAGVRGAILKIFATKLYRRALRNCECVFVQNDDIGEYLRNRRVVQQERLVVVPGSGVDTEYYREVPILGENPTFLLVARLLRDKGIYEFIEAARITRKKLPSAHFFLVGGPDKNPTSISIDEVRSWEAEGLITYFGHLDDIRIVMARSTVFVLPSYHEGMPRSVLEAMAMGRPIITTETPGCKATVVGGRGEPGSMIRWGENGATVPIRSVDKLAEAMVSIGSQRELTIRMGRRSRELAEKLFDVRKVNELMLAEILRRRY